jgi:hypothetical protein
LRFFTAPHISLLKIQKRAVARFLMLQVDIINVQPERLSVHAINHKEKLKFIPQYITSRPTPTRFETEKAT